MRAMGLLMIGIAMHTLPWIPNNLHGQVYCQSYAIVRIDTCTSSIELDRRPTADLTSGALLLLHRSQGAIEYGIAAAGAMMLCSLDTVSDRRIFLQEDIRQLCAPDAKLQLVIPLHVAELDQHDDVRCMPWNGRHGGIIAIVDRVIDIRHKRIDASGCGFRGGYNVFSTSDTTISDVRSWNLRSESYATRTDLSSGSNGNPRNGGGAGGSMSGFGGNGGGTSTAFQPPQPGGTSSNAALHQRTVFGAGGGAGHRNDLNTSTGGRGGGLIILVADSIIADASTNISAAGLPGTDARYDGAGGGGAGGTIVLAGAGRFTSGTIDLRGGGGGNVVAGLFASGPGGGGAGGTLVTSGPLPVSTILGTGGKAGLVLGMQQNPDPHGAQNGEDAIFQAGQEVFLQRTMRRALPLLLKARDSIVPYGSTTMIYAKAEGLISWNDPDVVPLALDGSVVETPGIIQARWFGCRVITPSGCMQSDSIRIAPELETVTLVVDADYSRAKPGDTIDVFIRMTLSGPLDRHVQGVAIISSYAGVAQALRGRLVAGQRTSVNVPFSIAPGTTSTFRREKFAVVLGDSVATQLRIDSVLLERPTLQVRRRHGRISLDDICVAGGRTRLFNPYTPTFKIEGRRITAYAQQAAVIDILGREVQCGVSRHTDATILQIPQHVRGALFLFIENNGHAVTTPFWLE
jgi:hypothetical protein